MSSRALVSSWASVSSRMAQCGNIAERLAQSPSPSKACVSAMPQRFDREQVDAILGRAIERDRSVDALTREQLMAIAAEIGVSSESVNRAIEEIAVEDQRKLEMVRLRQQAWRGFLFHLIPYLCVNGLLVILNLLTTDFPWALFPILGWGIGLLSHLLAVAFPNPERLERLLQREQERKRRRELKRQMKRGAEELGSAVGEGVVALLHAAAGRLNEGAASAQRQNRPRVDVNGPPNPRVNVNGPPYAQQDDERATSDSEEDEQWTRGKRRL